jgi:hypothetical protein
MKTRIIAAALAAFFMLPFFAVTAYAVEIDELPDDVIVIEEQPMPEETPQAPVTDYPENPPRPFTPSGTGAVIDYATDSEGKVFYTIMTPDEHVFYLVIDKQRNTENVYFLNAVTVDDLQALAATPKQTQGVSTYTPPPAATSEPPAEETPPPAEQPESGGNNMGTMIFIALIVVLGGGAGWYFKIYRPKQRGAASGEEYEPPVADDENGYPGDWGDEQDEADDSPPWDEDESNEDE